MKTICIPWATTKSYGERSGATKAAIEMSHWIKDLGLTTGTDYDWYFDNNQKETRFRFYNDAEMYATMFALKWMGT